MRLCSSKALEASRCMPSARRLVLSFLLPEGGHFVIWYSRLSFLELEGPC